MITVYSGCAGSNVVVVEHIDPAKEARRRARKVAPKAGAVRKIEDKRRKQVKHVKPLREEY